jgi:hypothetical protein
MSHYPRPIPMTTQLKALRGASAAITGVATCSAAARPPATPRWNCWPTPPSAPWPTPA